jgi:hypothetical protein
MYTVILLTGEAQIIYVHKCDELSLNLFKASKKTFY